MYNPEQPAKPVTDEIKCDHIGISIIHPDDFRDYLESDTHYTQLYTSIEADELPGPVREALLSYARDDRGIEIEGTLRFDPSDIAYHHPGPWQATISGAMCHWLLENDYTSYTLRHELHDLYVQLNPLYAAHLRFEANTDSCSVSVSLQQITEPGIDLLAATMMMTPNNAPDIYEVFKQFTNIWAQTIDAVANQYGTVETDHVPVQIILAAPEIETEEAADSAAQDTELPFPTIESYASSKQSLRMLGGLEHPKQKIQSIVDTYADPIGAKMYGITPKHFMLYGPPGTGKSSLVEALAGDIDDATLRYIPSSDIMGGLVGSSGANLAAIFDEVFKQTVPCVLFFDEFDAIAGSSNNDSVSHTEVKKLLNQYIAEASQKYPHVIIAAATNLDPHQIEDSLIRSGRLEPIAVLKPNEHERADIWAAVIAQSYVEFANQTDPIVDPQTEQIESTSQFVPYARDINPPELATLTDDMTGADFAQILRSARTTCYRHYKHTGEQRLVDQALLIDTIQSFSR